MAKIQKLKKSTRGKEIKCSKCKTLINAGDFHLKAIPYKKSPIIRCTSCGLKEYETYGSEYRREVGAIVEDWISIYGTSDGTAEEIAEELENIKETQEDSLDNIPEQLIDGDVGTMLQTRIDSLEDAINELGNISYEDLKDEVREEAENNVGAYDEEDEDCEFDSEEAWENAVSEEVDNLVEEAYSDAIDEALSYIVY